MPSEGEALSGSSYYGTSFVAVGGWLDSADLGNTSDSFDPFETKGTYFSNNQLDVKRFYNEFYREYFENEWFQFLVDYLVGGIFTGYSFKGAGADECETFFNKTCPTARQEIKNMGLNVIREGVGFLKHYTVDEKIKQIKAINARTATLYRHDYTELDKFRDIILDQIPKLEPSDLEDDDEYIKIMFPTIERTTVEESESDGTYFFRTWKNEEPEQYNNKYISMYKIKTDPSQTYGIPFGMSCFHAIKALKRMNRDVIASISKSVNNITVVAVDLEDSQEEDEKEAALQTVLEPFKKLETATSGTIAIDKRHIIYDKGSGHSGGTGNSSARLVSVMEYIEPVLSSVLMNYLMAIGIIEQTGANKSLIARQEVMAREQKRKYQKTFAALLKNQVLRYITKKDVEVYFHPELDAEELNTLFVSSVISREYVTDYLGIVDNGKTFVPIEKPQENGGFGSSSSSNNEDEPSKKRKIKPDKTVKGKGGGA